jgi:hypothetical protein
LSSNADVLVVLRELDVIPVAVHPNNDVADVARSRARDVATSGPEQSATG